MTDDGLEQPEPEDGRWTIDEQRHFVGMDCSVERDGSEVDGEVAAIWSFPGRAQARRRPARGRRSVQHVKKSRQLRKFVTAMKLYKATYGSGEARRIEPTKQATTVEPAPDRAGPAKSLARAGVRTGFYRGRRNKRLAFSSGRAIRRGVFGRRCDTPQHEMSEYTQNDSTNEGCVTAVTGTDEKPFFSRREGTAESVPLHEHSKNAIQRCGGGAVSCRGAGGVACHPTHPTQGSVGSEGGSTTLRPKTSLGGWSWRWS